MPAREVFFGRRYSTGKGEPNMVQELMRTAMSFERDGLIRTAKLLEKATLEILRLQRLASH